MRSRPLAAVAVACLAVLAGCGAFVGGSPGGVETVTPVPLTDREPTATAGAATGTPRLSRPPGVGADGTVNVTRLVAAHEAYVADRSYRWTFRYAVAVNDSAVYAPDYTRRVVVGPDAFLVAESSPGIGANESLFVADGEGYLRRSRGNETEFSRVAVPRSPGSYVFVGEAVRRFMVDVSFDVTVVERGGQTYYRLHTTGSGAPGPVNERNRPAWNYTATAYVTPAGFVRTLVVEYDRAESTEVRHVRVRYDYAAIGATTVDRPSWVSAVTPVPTPTPTAAPVDTATVTTTGSENGTQTQTPAASTPKHVRSHSTRHTPAPGAGRVAGR